MKKIGMNFEIDMKGFISNCKIFVNFSQNSPQGNE